MACAASGCPSSGWAASPGLRGELTSLLYGVAFRIWSDLIARAQDTPKATGLLHLPRFPRVPAEMRIHRRDLDRASGVPNRGGMFAVIGLQFDPVQNEDSGGWLTVRPPACWDTSWEDFIADMCHGMFGFEKPRWHYIPEFGALLDALAKAAQTLPEARSRFLCGDLPPGGRLMVRYDAVDADEFRWARVESWEDAGHWDCLAHRSTVAAPMSAHSVTVRNIAKSVGAYVRGERRRSLPRLDMRVGC
jgi:hypothetical protein